MDPAETMDKVLDAIYDEARALLNRDDVPKTIREGLERIEALARYKLNVVAPRASAQDAGDDRA